MAEAQSPPTVSRYRTQRKARQAQSGASPTQSTSSQQTSSPVQTVNRSKSRYHRPATASSEAPPPPFVPPARDSSTSSRPRDGPSHTVSSSRSRHETHKVNAVEVASTKSPDSTTQSRNRYAQPKVAAREDQVTREKRTATAQVNARPPQQARSPVSDEKSPPQSHRAQLQTTQDPAKHLVPARGPDGPPASRQIRATRSNDALSAVLDDENDTAGCFSLFRRKRVETPEQHDTSKPVTTPTKGPKAIIAGGGGIVPGIDAPVSAVNAGDRCVLVECGKSKRIFPVTPETTPVDLIKSAATVMSEPIDVHGAILLEHFGTVGVERPLRRYERIRDVLNSWNSDKQNSLLLVDPGTGGSETELSVSGVPSQKPPDTSWLVLYSQKPGKWDRRTISVKSDGQVTSQKDANKSQTAENICHLSDFDIYTPTQDKARKKIKPPKRYCFAIKSQQKTSMFESTQNFVHFFSTGDKAISEGFYSAVQRWRSWYLVNVLGEGRKPGSVPGSAGSKQESAAKGHRPQESFSSHYQLGSFQPLLETAQFEAREEPATEEIVVPPEPFAKNTMDNQASEKRPSTRHRAHPPLTTRGREYLAEDEPLANLGRRVSRKGRGDQPGQAKSAAPQEFASTGLLGRSYSQRRREAEAQAQDDDAEGPWVSGPNLLNGRATDGIVGSNSPDEAARTGLHRRQSTREGRGRVSNDLARSNSRTEKPKPLIDLTPQYREPPQHSRKGRGHKPEVIGMGGLVEAATSPDDPLGIPSSTDWRARPGEPRHRGTSVSQPSHRPMNSLNLAGQSAFTADGLLSQGQTGWGGGDCGRGVVDGSRAKGSLLDVTESSKFVQGSLLNHVELVQGRDGPIIDREKWVEREEKTGEGF